MNLGIAGKTAIVTGASAGIGRAIAREFAESGVNLVLVARRATPLSEAAKEIGNRFAVKVLPIVADVGSPDEPDQVVASALERFGSIDILVNNAGRACAGGIMAASESEWEEMTATKLSAMRRFCRAVIPHMRQRHWGRIITISSIGGIYPNFRLIVSHALSAAINNLTRSIALEVARDGILVNAIARHTKDCCQQQARRRRHWCGCEKRPKPPRRRRQSSEQKNGRKCSLRTRSVLIYCKKHYNHTNESAPDSIESRTLVRTAIPEVCSQPPKVLHGTVRMAWTG